MSVKHRDRHNPVYLEPTSVIGMLLYCVLLVAGFACVLGYVPGITTEPRASSTTAIDVPAALTTDETIGYR